MNIAADIRKRYGVQMIPVPADGKMRAFKIDPFRIGFAINLGDCGSFGCWAEGEIFTVNELGEVGHIHRKQLRSTKALDFERLIIEIARAQHKKNGGLTVEENDRLQQAVKFVEVHS